jgi:hypothetical protein
MQALAINAIICWHTSKRNIMPSLSVRRIDSDVYERLRIRAPRHGVSMEEEVRRILRRSVAAPERLGDLALQYFGTDGVE